MAKVKKRVDRSANGAKQKRPHRFLIATEPKRLTLWREQAAKHNVSLATWVRWACDLVVERDTDRLDIPPTGEVAVDGIQL